MYFNKPNDKKKIFQAGKHAASCGMVLKQAMTSPPLPAQVRISSMTAGGEVIIACRMQLSTFEGIPFIISIRTSVALTATMTKSKSRIDFMILIQLNN